GGRGDGGGLTASEDLVPEMTGGEVVRLDLEQLRLFFPTQLLCERAARMEPTAARRIDRARHVAREDDALALALDRWIGNRHRRQQRLGIWVQGSLIQEVARGQLDDL